VRMMKVSKGIPAELGACGRLLYKDAKQSAIQ